jgi:hypothetical protein
MDPHHPESEVPPPSPSMNDRDAKTPIETPPSIVELNANTTAIGALTGEIGRLSGAVDGMAKWSRDHDAKHLAGELQLESVATEVRELTRRKRIQWLKYGGVFLTATGMFVGAVKWAVSAHDTFILHEAKAAAQALDTAALVANQPAIDRTAQQAAERTARLVSDDTRRQLEEDRVARERAANMRVAAAGGKR